jgi:hypothetical protein
MVFQQAAAGRFQNERRLDVVEHRKGAQEEAAKN